MTNAETEIIIEAGHTERNYRRGLFRYPDLFYFLAWRDVPVCCKQTVIDILRTTLRPFFTMVAFAFILGGIGKLLAEGVPYTLTFFTAILRSGVVAPSRSGNAGTRSFPTPF